MADRPAALRHQTLIGAGALVLGRACWPGARVDISSAAGYAGVGPNFLPWVVAAVLALCGAWLIYEARTRRLARDGRAFGRGARRLGGAGLGGGRHRWPTRR